MEDSIVKDMAIPATHFAQMNFSGATTSWIYICVEPNEGMVLELGKFIQSGQAKYVAMCWEKSLGGRQLLIVFMVFPSIRSANSLKTRFGFTGGILLAKTQRRIMLTLVVQWMKGNFYFEGKLKPANRTFQEMRKVGYMMRGRERDKDFLEAVLDEGKS